MTTIPPERMTDDDRARAERVKAICDQFRWPFTGLIDPRSMRPGWQPQNQVDRSFNLLIARLNLMWSAEGGAR